MTLVVAHRGMPAVAPDNSLAGFAAAVEAGADAVELDVRRRSDGVLVCHHDSGDAAGAPTLAEAIATVGGRVPLQVDVKETGFEEEVTAQLAAALAPDRYWLTSLEDASIARFRRLDPRIRCALTLGRERPTPYVRTRLSELYPFRRVDACGALELAPEVRLVQLGLGRRARRRGVGLMVWTVDDERRLRWLFERVRPATVITNRLELALWVRAGRSRPER